MLALCKPIETSLIFRPDLPKWSTLQVLSSRLGSWPYPQNIKRANALAYFVSLQVKKKKRFITLTPEAVFLVMCDPSMNEL